MKVKTQVIVGWFITAYLAGKSAGFISGFSLCTVLTPGSVDVSGVASSGILVDLVIHYRSQSHVLKLKALWFGIDLHLLNQITCHSQCGGSSRGVCPTWPPATVSYLLGLPVELRCRVNIIPFSAGIVFRRPNLTSRDGPRTGRIRQI